MLKNDGEVLATITASPARRVMGAGMLGGLGCPPLYLAMAAPPSPGWLAFLLVVGAASPWCGMRLRQAHAPSADGHPPHARRPPAPPAGSVRVRTGPAGTGRARTSRDKPGRARMSMDEPRRVQTSPAEPKKSRSARQAGRARTSLHELG